jgi:hypothetical protein
MLFYLKFVTVLDCKVDVSKIYASHLSLWEHIGQTYWTKWEKKIAPESLMKLLVKQEWTSITSNHSKLLVASLKSTHETKKT